MIKLTILYPNKEDGTFDFDYYLNRHMPMSIERQGSALRGVTVEHGLCGIEPGSPPEYVAICHLFFDSLDAFLDAFMPHAGVLQGDICNYTDIEPVIQLSEVEIHKSFELTAGTIEARGHGCPVISPTAVMTLDPAKEKFELPV